MKQANLSLWKNIQFLQLTTEELKIFRFISKVSPSQEGKIHHILFSYRKKVVSLVRLAIFNPWVRQWCRQNLLSTWKQTLPLLNQRMGLSYQFKPQKKLSVFDLVAGSILLNEAFVYPEKSAEETLLLYLAMELFYSSQATYLITDRTLTTLRLTRNEKLIVSMSRILENISNIHGALGYLIYSFFNYQVAVFFLENNEEQQAAGALYLCYQFLLTASKLEKNCSVELLNFSAGNSTGLIKELNDNLKIDDRSNQIPFSQLMTFYKENYSQFIIPIEQAAEQTARQLAAHW